jgi:hypothetical protein
MEIIADIVDRFNKRMNNKQLKKRYIKVDIAVAYDPLQIKHMLVIKDFYEYKHLMDCYNISEQELKKCFWEILYPDKPYVKSSKWLTERTFS